MPRIIGLTGNIACGKTAVGHMLLELGAVSLAMMGELVSVSPTGSGIIDAVKSLEGDSGKFCQSKWMVICSEEQELARLISRNALSEEEAWARIRAQPPVGARLALVDEV